MAAALRWSAAAAAALLVALALAPAAPAAGPPLPEPGRYATPEGFAVSARQAARAAAQEPDVVRWYEEDPGLRVVAKAKEPTRWELFYYSGGEAVVLVYVDSQSGEAFESWTGYQVSWGMARGREGQFGHALNAPYVWIPLAALFFFVLFDWCRPARWAHLDLLLLLSFGASHVFFNHAEIGVSVPLAYPPLVYLLARMLWVGFRGGAGLRPRVPAAALLALCLLLVAFRITLNTIDSGVIDVGYAGVIGADRIADGEPVWGLHAFPENNRHGDTYGPANYLAYVPFEQLFPWSGAWDQLKAAHAAAIFFDLATVLGLFVLGLRLRAGERRAGIHLGLVLAFAWLAYPYTAFALQSNSNDALIASLVVWALVAWSSPAWRSALIATAAMAKFAPLALAPLIVTGERSLPARLREGSSRLAALRPAAVGALAFGFVCAAMLALPAIDPGLGTFWERTVANQLDRESPFSIWGQVEGIEWLQKVVLAAAAALALSLAFIPAARPLPRAAALAAAVTIALQLAVDHWFYLYIPWFCGLVFVALVGVAGGPHVEGDRTPQPLRTAGRPG